MKTITLEDLAKHGKKRYEDGRASERERCEALSLKRKPLGKETINAKEYKRLKEIEKHFDDVQEFWANTAKGLIKERDEAKTEERERCVKQPFSSKKSVDGKERVKIYNLGYDEGSINGRIEERKRCVKAISEMKTPYHGELNPKVVTKQECKSWKFGHLVFSNTQADAIKAIEELQ